MSIEETINEIIQNKKSISRFGDGEFRLILDNTNIGFQKGNAEITRKLRKTLQSELPNHIVALPETFSKKNSLNWRSKYWWLNFINSVGIYISPYLDSNRSYGNSFITRFYLNYEKKDHLPNTVKQLKKIWENQDILLIEGRYSRLGIGNDLFDEVKSLQRVLCPEKDAFSKYSEIMAAAKSFGRHRLILLALGPTATVLAYDLALEDYWVIDIGHVDLEYMWYLRGAKEKTCVEGRLVNESEKQLSLEIPEQYKNKYFSSIIKEI